MSQASASSLKLSEMQFRIVKPIGTGAGSRVFQINDTKKGGYYALKVVQRQSADDEIYLAQALQEAAVGPKLNHPNIMKIFDHRVKKAWFKVAKVELLLEFIDGRALDELEMPERPQLVLMFCHVASALGHMHRRGVYHGDLKPGNIMLSKAGDVKVIDFGTAWIKGQDKSRVQGTPQYMAPEQAKDKVVNDKTDIFNLGATMYKMFTGHHANISGIPGGPEDNGLGHRGKVRAPIKLDPKIPAVLNDAIMACLQTNPDARPAGAYEVEAQLKAVAKQMGLKADDLRGIEEEEDEAWDDE
ncbi:MAG: serine/threonine protein kinase [Planctomycetota bacterium]|nr:serine/threonine protein kinase [Planctomycetota bacterium]